MRSRAETLLVVAMALFAFIGMMALHFMGSEPGVGPAPVDPALVGPAVLPTAANPESGSVWFDRVRGYCNPVDVTTKLRWQPAPDSDDGRMYEAACYALAGKVDLARRSIERLPPAQRHRAAGVVFNAGHPAADAGDELAAGPLMELVVEYWPNHYMALYHAGAASFQRGERERAYGYLTRFLQEYAIEDGWRSSALSMLETIEG